MKINYNDWFYKTHAYLSNVTSSGLIDYNDTKWVPVNDRYRRLVELESELLEEQPFGIVGNRRGFNKLIDLLEESNYSFTDINDSLIETYRDSLTNAMSRMVVNTHAVMFKCSNTDRRYVSSDKFSHYYIVDVPFNQLHFGDRDEFIRQQLDKMHTVANDRYIPLEEFVNNPYTKLLGFALMCCVNGLISNDCQVALDDKGFKFKIGWPYDYKHCDFIIYKFDDALVYHTQISVNSLETDGRIGKEAFGIYDGTRKCIANIFDANYSRTVASVPNFGTMSDTGLTIHNLQPKTLKDFENQKTKVADVVVYVLKYFHEVPNVYPAVNYFDIVDTRRVFDSSGLNVTDSNDRMILSSSTTDINELEVCTPPIVLDRPVSLSFKTIIGCLGLRETMTSCTQYFRRVGALIGNGKTINNNTFQDMKRDMGKALKILSPCYHTYLQGALLTSLVNSERTDRFGTLIDNITNFVNNNKISDIPKLTDYSIFPELYSDNYKEFIEYVVEPFSNETLNNFSDIMRMSTNYYIDDNSTRFNRPVSEQCFIAMKYNRLDECWVFDVPDIRHFKGIGNSFYIDNDLEGNEIFKFFVLYTDTESPSELNVKPLDMETVFDFDVFSDEVKKHMGYIRYWNAENKLMKLCKTVYNSYDGEKVVQVLSKILKRKLSGEDIIDIYPTEMNYEPSNETSLNWKGYNEYSDNAPFAINFMFYTISLMNDNEDKLQSYFYRTLTKKMYNNRYSDIDVSSVIDHSDMFPVNFSKISIAPLGVEVDSSNFPSASGTYGFYGIPYLVNNTGDQIIDTPYRYTFNTYEDERHYPILVENDLSNDHYLGYSSVANSGGGILSFRNDILLAKLSTLYLTYCYDIISTLQTNYQTAFNTITEIKTSKETIDSVKEKILSLYNDNQGKFIHPGVSAVINVLTNDIFQTRLLQIVDTISSIENVTFNGRSRTIEDVTDELLKVFQSIYKNTGFDDGVNKRVRNLYIHLKKINTCQSIYQYSKWVEDLDVTMLQNLERSRSSNENMTYGYGLLPMFAAFFVAYKNDVISKIEMLKSLVNGLIDDMGTHFNPIIDFCDDIIHDYIFDMYVIDTFEYDDSVSYNTKPYIISVELTASNQLHPPVGTIIETNPTLIFQPVVEMVNGSWKINSISKICEYAFFSPEALTATMKVLDSSGNTIQPIPITMNFIRIGSSADDMSEFNQFPNIRNTAIDIQNIHEDFEINSSNHVVNKKFGKMNYELLIGNSFTQLDHTSELVLEPKTWLPGSIDRLYLAGSTLNKLTNREFGQHSSYDVYFKPSQVLHIPLSDDGLITSIGGKYFVDQTLYLITDDGKYTFPVIVTAVDSSESNGFVEAIVDAENAKWFKVDDLTEITRYLKNNITCTVIDDNICNFLDEYSNPTNRVYQVPEYDQSFDPSDEDNPNAYSMPGDPLYVTSNARYVYTRLNWIFNEYVPNRYMDSHPQQHHMIYVGDSSINTENDDIRIKLINHSFETLTNPDKYPVLRTEPDDHFVWEEEKKVFQEAINTKIGQNRGIQNSILILQKTWGANPNKTTAAWNAYKMEMARLENESNKINADISRFRSYLTQLEYPTTWYNVRTYESAMVYIKNGRAVLDPGHIANIRNIPYTNKLKVYMYDWEHHLWIDPKSYSVTIDEIDSVRIGEYDNYKTNKVLNSIIIEPKDSFQYSQHILVYFAYDKSDVFEDIEINDKQCEVKFKPILSLDKRVDDYDPYSKINIRKHFDGYESYTFDNLSDVDNFSHQGYLIRRPKRSGKLGYSPSIRYCDMSVSNGQKVYPFTDFDLYIRIPFLDVTTSEKYTVPTYSNTIIQPIDGFVPNQTIKLICISNNLASSYDGNISSVMFEAYTSTNEAGKHQLTITNTTLPNYIYGTYLCTVLQDDSYPHSGGIISVRILPKEEDVIDGNWIRIPDSLSIYKDLPDELVVVPKQEMDNEDVTIIFKTTYLKDTDDVVSSKNEGMLNPYEYYFNSAKDIRYPISDVRRNQYMERLVIDRELNPDVKLIKSTYLSVCRYARQKIPQNGIIDMTGYLPTPLSRDRYEFWVNGRCIRDTENVKIISPTSIQLINLKSLRNFECIELVDDIDDSILMKKGPVYVDINGRTYASHKLAIMSRQSIAQQDIRYMFNANNQKPIHTYTSSIISNPNNRNIEQDILDTLSFEEKDPEYYEELHNLPSINGVDIFHPKSHHLGLIETPNEEILKLFDQVWKREASSNPLFPMSHVDGLNLINGERIALHSRYSGKDGKYILYASGISNQFFTFYISKRSDGNIDDTQNTLKIMPFIRTGVLVYIDKDFQGRWLCCTHPNVKPIKIM